MTISGNPPSFQYDEPEAKAPPDRERLAHLRGGGWSVAVHNDYRQDGETRTFWLLTHPSGRWIKGEGLTDETALAECEAAVTAGEKFTVEWDGPPCPTCGFSKVTQQQAPFTFDGEETALEPLPPSPKGGGTMIDRADKLARDIADGTSFINEPIDVATERTALRETIAAALRSYAAEITAERDRLAELATAATAARDRSEDRARQAEAELIAMTAERARQWRALKPLVHLARAVDASMPDDYELTCILTAGDLRRALSSPTPEGAET